MIYQSKTAEKFEGELFRSRNKKFNELIFFVHFYDGSKKQLLRHIRLVNALGFDAFAFNLEGTFKDILIKPSILGSFKRPGLKHRYADQIEFLLNDLSGDKIVFSFSNPSAGAIEALARRKCQDIKALICDSGPSQKFVMSAVRLLQQNYIPRFPLLSWILAPVTSLIWSPYLHRDLKKHLKVFPENFPVLTIQSEKDLLIPSKDIDLVFSPHAHLLWRKLVLPEAGHLHGLRDFKDIYSPELEKFLYNVSTRS